MSNKKQIKKETEVKTYTFDQLEDMAIEVNGYNGALEHLDYKENGEDFFNDYYSDDVAGAVRASCYGDYNYTDEYVIINGYGNLETISDYQYKKVILEHKEEIITAYNKMKEKEGEDK